jgi:hypothetical protein
MTDEGKEKMYNDLKAKAINQKNEAGLFVVHSFSFVPAHWC